MNLSFNTKSREQENFKEYVTNLTNGEEKIAFDKLYSFYIPKKEYKAQINALKINPNFYRSAWCLLGEGSSWGCCGNYEGCCWYWAPLCYIHDWQCTNCEPSWYCLSGCIPDGENEDEDDEAPLPTGD